MPYKYTSLIPRICQRCGKDFRATPPQVRRGAGKFCSAACQNQPNVSDAERFWSKVDRSGGPDACWPFLASPGTPRGLFCLGGRNLMPSRAAYILTHGTIPSGMEVCHDCPGGDNPRCVNPAHFFLGTHAENMADMARKGKRDRGERHYSTHLTEADVREIRRRAEQGENQSAIARDYAIGAGAVYRIVKRKNWKHVA